MQVCAKEALCPTLTTCVQTDDVFTSEMKKLRGTEDFDLTDLFRSQTRLLDRLHSQSWLDAAVWKTTWTTASEDYEVTTLALQATEIEKGTESV